jgi:hypothetical protein
VRRSTKVMICVLADGGLSTKSNVGSLKQLEGDSRASETLLLPLILRMSRLKINNKHGETGKLRFRQGQLMPRSATAYFTQTRTAINKREVEVMEELANLGEQTSVTLWREYDAESILVVRAYSLAAQARRCRKILPCHRCLRVKTPANFATQ